MLIGDRLRSLREHKKLSQGHIEQRTGLLRCYISRVENGHTVPAIETLEKFARALDVPLYQLLYEGNESPKIAKQPSDDDGWGQDGKDRRTLDRFRKFLSRIDKNDRELLLSMAQKMQPNGRRKVK